MDREKLLDDINAGLQALVREDIQFAGVEELPPLSQRRDFKFAEANIPPPTTLYVSEDEFLRITIWHNDTAAIFTAAARVLTSDGAVRLLLANATPDLLGFFIRIDLPRISGALLSLSVSLAYNGAISNPVYAVASLVAGGGATATDVGVFASGYVSTLSPLMWPWSVRQQPGDGPGSIRSFGVTSPAAGNNIVIPIISFVRWRVLAVVFSVTCSAAVANRRAFIYFDDGVNFLWNWQDTVVLTAGQSRIIELGVGTVTDSQANGNILNRSMPPVWMVANFRVQLGLVNIQAGDQISGIILYVEEWIVP